ncbi:MAG: hypothetical protein MJE77_41690 [Proteobacteria bacterium]|nr:hypothetical protein [Pseudomonadota bacterium]
MYPEKRTLTVLRRTDDGYQVILEAGAGNTVHAAPFDEVELDMRVNGSVNPSISDR